VIRSVVGRLAAVEADAVVVEVGGVGLLLRVSASSARALPAVGQTVRLTTHLVVREDALDLYGFIDDVERRLFDQLISVSGVGPRMALAILGVDDADGVRLAIARGDTAKIQRAAGVGKRTAERVVLDLRDRITAGPATPPGDGDGPAGVNAAEAFLAARDALVALGFRGEEADAALAGAPSGVDAEALIRHGLAGLRKS
jgi:holliday junction DNA helicase RuvA